MIEEIARQIALRGGRAFFAGGWVRDRLLNRSEKVTDIDIEVFYLQPEKLAAVLEEFGTVKRVGSNFRVFKLKGWPALDFVLPEPVDADFESACRRRDFTVNAILMDVMSGEIIDPLGGRKDLANKTIKVSHPANFQNDPLRAYRAAVLAARLDFQIEESTIELMKQCSLQGVNKERVFAELVKLLLLADRPSPGLIYLEETGILAELHPDLHKLVGCPQAPDHHPEGDAWRHTLYVVDRAAAVKNCSRDPEVFMLSALLHDIGKPLVTAVRNNRFTAYGHDTVGAHLAQRFLQELRCSKRKAERVAALVREHMRPVLLFKTREQVGDRAIRKLASRVDTRELLLLSEADYLGRDVKRDFEPVKQWLTDRLRRVGLRPGQGIAPLVRGRDLVDRGYQPGSGFKGMLDFAFSLQLDGFGKEQILHRIDRKYTH